jgi:hypothetical protein
LPLTVIQEILHRIGVALRPDIDTTGLRRGHRTVLIDGSSLSRSDTPELRRHFGCRPQTARDVLRAVLDRGIDILNPFRSGLAPDSRRYHAIAGALRELLDEERTWTSRQLNRDLADRGIAQEPDINKDDTRAMIQKFRQGIVDRPPPVVLEGEVDCDEVSVVAGHKGHPEAVTKRPPPPEATAERRTWSGHHGQGEAADLQDVATR